MTDGYLLIVLLSPFVVAILLGAILGTADEILDYYSREETCSAPDADPPYNPFASHVVGENHGQR